MHTTKINETDLWIHTRIPVNVPLKCCIQSISRYGRELSTRQPYVRIRRPTHYDICQCLAGKHAFPATIHALAARLTAWLFCQPPTRPPVPICYDRLTISSHSVKVIEHNVSNWSVYICGLFFVEFSILNLWFSHHPSVIRRSRSLQMAQTLATEPLRGRL